MKINKGKVLIAMFLCASMLAGCGEKKESVKEVDVSSLDKVTETKLPISEENLKLSIWTENYANRTIQNYGDMESWKEIEKRTGIDLEFIHPTGAAAEQFNIMLASRDYPDIIYNHWSDSLGKQVKDGVCIELTPYVDKIMPNLSKLIKENPNIEKQIKLVDGSIVHFPQINALDQFNYWDGYFIREDWLKKTGKSIPTDINEWYDLLVAFKNSDLNGNGKNDEIPFSTTKGMFPTAFIGAFGIGDYFFLSPETGKVTFKSLESSYRDYLETMHKWYEEGLLDPEYLTNDSKVFDSKMLNDTVGATYIDSNNSMINYMRVKKDEGFKLVPVPFPKNSDGKSYYSRGGVKTLVTNYGGVISTSCKHPVEAIELCDYLYSQEGTMLLNWGIEGKSYEIKDGKPRYTEEILNNPEGKTPYDAITKYCTNSGFMKLYLFDAIKGLDDTLEKNIAEIKDTSVKFASDADKALVLPPLRYGTEETKEFTRIKTDLFTYINEMEAKYIFGKESFDTFDEFVEKTKKLGVERAVEIVQKAYDDYNAG